MNLKNFDDLLALLKRKAIIQNKNYKKHQIKIYYKNNVLDELCSKELEKTYSTGSIDDSKYKKQGEELRGRLNGITSKINKIRRVISSL